VLKSSAAGRKSFFDQLKRSRRLRNYLLRFFTVAGAKKKALRFPWEKRSAFKRLSEKPAARPELLLGQALLKRFDALWADVLAVEHDDVLGIVAEDTGGLILPQNDGRTIHVDLKGIFLRDVQGAAQLDGKHDTAQLINFPHNTGRFQFDHPFLVIRDRRKAIETARNM
jgi:hypothetical protein